MKVQLEQILTDNSFWDHLKILRQQLFSGGLKSRVINARSAAAGPVGLKIEQEHPPRTLLRQQNARISPVAIAAGSFAGVDLPPLVRGSNHYTALLKTLRIPLCLKVLSSASKGALNRLTVCLSFSCLSL